MAEKIEQIIVSLVAGNPASRPMPLRLLGTAFFVGNARTFLTAWHVIELAEDAKRQGEEVFLLGREEGLRHIPIVDVQRPNARADIAVGLAGVDVSSHLILSGEKLGFGNNVYCLGYPLHLFQESPGRTQISNPLKFMILFKQDSQLITMNLAFQYHVASADLRLYLKIPM